MNQSDLIAMYGRISAHEFLLEVTWANALVNESDELADETFRQLINRSRQGELAKGSSSKDSDLALAVGQECTTVIERFCDKVRDRRDNLRDIRSRAE